MSTLFHLQTDITDYKNNIQQVYEYGQIGDAVLIMGKSVGVCEMILDYATQLDVEKYRNINWYALQTEMNTLNPTLQQNMPVDKLEIDMISDEEWVGLVQRFDKVVTITN